MQAPFHQEAKELLPVFLQNREQEEKIHKGCWFPIAPCPSLVFQALYKDPIRSLHHLRKNVLACIRILDCISEILLRQPFPLLVILGNVDPFDLENDRPRTVITTGDHHAVIIRPAFHDRAALKGSVDIPAHGIPCLAAELAVHQMIEIVLLRRTLQNKFVSHIEEWTGAGLGIRQILLLVIGKAFLIYHCDFAFVLHIIFLSSQTF